MWPILQFWTKLLNPKKMSAIAEKYEQMLRTSNLRQDKKAEIDTILDKLITSKARYEAVARIMGNGIPFWFIMLCHAMEAGGKKKPFDFHLHCGDPLTGRTVHVPAGRPKANPVATDQPPSVTNPYSWEESALDALKYSKYDQITDWSIGNALDLFERFNGLGYRKKGIASPYLWSYTDKYIIGKYVADGKFDPAAISRQPGVCAFLLRLKEKGVVSF